MCFLIVCSLVFFFFSFNIINMCVCLIKWPVTNVKSYYFEHSWLYSVIQASQYNMLVFWSTVCCKNCHTFTTSSVKWNQIHYSFIKKKKLLSFAVYFPYNFVYIYVRLCLYVVIKQVCISCVEKWAHKSWIFATEVHSVCALWMWLVILCIHYDT